MYSIFFTSKMIFNTYIVQACAIKIKSFDLAEIEDFLLF